MLRLLSRVSNFFYLGQLLILWLRGFPTGTLLHHRGGQRITYEWPALPLSIAVLLLLLCRMTSSKSQLTFAGTLSSWLGHGFGTVRP